MRLESPFVTSWKEYPLNPTEQGLRGRCLPNLQSCEVERGRLRPNLCHVSLTRGRPQAPKTCAAAWIQVRARRWLQRESAGPLRICGGRHISALDLVGPNLVKLVIALVDEDDSRIKPPQLPCTRNVSVLR